MLVFVLVFVSVFVLVFVFVFVVVFVPCWARAGNSGCKPFFRAVMKSVVWKPTEIAVKNVVAQLAISRSTNFGWSVPVPVVVPVVVCVWS